MTVRELAVIEFSIEVFDTIKSDVEAVPEIVIAVEEAYGKLEAVVVVAMKYPEVTLPVSERRN